MLNLTRIISRPSSGPSSSSNSRQEADRPAPRTSTSSTSSQQQHRRRSRRHRDSKKSKSATSKVAQASLLHVRLRAQDSEGLKLSCPNEECVICAETFNTDDVVTTLPCGHMHHSNCVLHWLHRQCTCPTCRFDLNKHAKGEQQLQQQAMVLKLSSAREASTVASKSDNFDLIMRRTLRMKMEAEQRNVKYSDDSEEESLADTVDSMGSLSLNSVNEDAALDHAHFLELYA